MTDEKKDRFPQFTEDNYAQTFSEDGKYFRFKIKHPRLLCPMCRKTTEAEFILRKSFSSLEDIIFDLLGEIIEENDTEWRFHWKCPECKQDAPYKLNITPGGDRIEGVLKKEDVEGYQTSPYRRRPKFL